MALELSSSTASPSCLRLWIALVLVMLGGFPMFSVARRLPLGGIVKGSWHRSFVAPACLLRSSQVWSSRHAIDGICVCRANTAKLSTSQQAWMMYRGGATRHFSSPNKHVDVLKNSTLHRAYIAVGSNLGDRHVNIASALKLLCCDSDCNDDENGPSVITRLVQTSFLHETAPMYMTDQPNFLNGVVEIVTNLSPHDLLQRIKYVEASMGRDLSSKSVRNGPRPVDLDIVMYEIRNEQGELEQLVLNTPDLVIPHVGMVEREFVLKPLCELVSEETSHPVLNTTVSDLLERLKHKQTESGAEECAVRVLPLPRGRMLCFNETIIMGILNVTPDSFSDGGKLEGSVETAVKAALQMEQDGARIIDIGGESTRPGAKEVAIEEEITRTIPVIRGVRRGELRYVKVNTIILPAPNILVIFRVGSVSDVPISIDTRHSEVARAAVEAGADIVNDVSGGTFDANMLDTVAELQVPVILMHMRGTPEIMQNMTDYNDVVSDVATALLERSRAAEYAGIPRWMQVLDPGIGFAKDLRGNLLLLKHMSSLRLLLRDLPILLGTSRKGFIGKIAGETEPMNRDFGSVASCVAALCLGDSDNEGCDILRVHNAKGMKQGAMIMDAIRRAR